MTKQEQKSLFIETAVKLMNAADAIQKLFAADAVNRNARMAEVIFLLDKARTAFDKQRELFTLSPAASGR